MTDRRKILHAIAVLKEMEHRTTTSDHQNCLDLCKLLEKPHVIPKKEIGRADPTWDIAVMLSKRLEAHIRNRKPNLRPIQLDTWATDMDKILRIDKRTPEKLQEIVDWCQQDSFWQNNILSPAKLRKQLDRLELQMANDYTWQKRKLHRQVERTGPSAKEIYMENIREKYK